MGTLSFNNLNNINDVTNINNELEKVDIIDSVDSTATDSALSANMGNELDTKIDTEIANLQDTIKDVHVETYINDANWQTRDDATTADTGDISAVYNDYSISDTPVNYDSVVNVNTNEVTINYPTTTITAKLTQNISFDNNHRLQLAFTTLRHAVKTIAPTTIEFTGDKPFTLATLPIKTWRKHLPLQYINDITLTCYNENDDVIYTNFVGDVSAQNTAEEYIQMIDSEVANVKKFTLQASTHASYQGGFNSLTDITIKEYTPNKTLKLYYKDTNDNWIAYATASTGVAGNNNLTTYIDNADWQNSTDAVLADVGDLAFVYTSNPVTTGLYYKDVGLNWILLDFLPDNVATIEMVNGLLTAINAGLDEIRLQIANNDTELATLDARTLATNITVNSNTQALNDTATKGEITALLDDKVDKADNTAEHTTLQANIDELANQPTLRESVLAWWDGQADPTVEGNATPLGTVSGSGVYEAGNGLKLTPATSNTNGGISFNFDHLKFMAIKFNVKVGGGTGGDATFFYCYTDAPAIIEKHYDASNTNPITTGYVIGFSEYSNRVMLSWGNTLLTEQEVIIFPYNIDLDDNVFRKFRIYIIDNRIRIYIDNTEIIDYRDAYNRDRTNTFFGFGGRNGGTNNNRFIKGFSVEKLLNAEIEP